MPPKLQPRDEDTDDEMLREDTTPHMTIAEAEKRIGGINCTYNELIGPYDPDHGGSDNPIIKVWCEEARGYVMKKGYKRAALPGYDESLAEVNNQIFLVDSERESYAKVDDVCLQRFKNQCNMARFSVWKCILTALHMWGEEADAERRRRINNATPNDTPFQTYAFLHEKYTALNLGQEIKKNQFMKTIRLHNRKVEEDALPESRKTWDDHKHEQFNKIVNGTIVDVAKEYDATFSAKKTRRHAPGVTSAGVHHPQMHIPEINLSDVMVGHVGDLSDDKKLRGQQERSRYVNGCFYGQKGSGKTQLALQMLKAKQRAGFKVYVIHSGGDSIMEADELNIPIDQSWNLATEDDPLATYNEAMNHIMAQKSENRVVFLDEMMSFFAENGKKAWKRLNKIKDGNSHNHITAIFTCQQYMQMDVGWRRGMEGGQSVRVFLNMGVSVDTKKKIRDDAFSARTGGAGSPFRGRINAPWATS